MDYPGHQIKTGESDASLVSILKRQLNYELAGGGNAHLILNVNNSTFNDETRQAVKLFQARHVDSRGVPLRQDGIVGPLTWVAMFGKQSVTSMDTSNDALLNHVIKIAKGEESKHVRESPPKSNSGPEIDLYLASTHTGPGNYWCCAFVYWCFQEAAQSLKRGNPMVRTPSCLDHWNLCVNYGARRILAWQAAQNPLMIQPGMIFIIDHGGGYGHTGLIEGVTSGLLTTIEGNTDASLNRDGDGVYRLTRKLNEINKGFIDYAGCV